MTSPATTSAAAASAPPRPTPADLLIQQMARRRYVQPATVAPEPTPAPASAPTASATPEVTRTGGETTQELWTKLRSSVQTHRNSLLEIAHYSYRLRTQNDWESLGFSSEDACRASLGMSAHKWKESLLLGERLSHLTLEQTRGITLEAARLLTSISASLWEEYAWVEESRLLSARQFALLVAERNHQANPKEPAIPRAVFSLKVPVTRMDALEARIDSLRRREKLATPAEVVEFALNCAEVNPAMLVQVFRLERVSEELGRCWIGQGEDAGQPGPGMTAAELASLLNFARRLSNQILKSVKELKKNVIAANPEQVAASEASLQAEVARDQEPSRATDAAR